MLRTTFSITMLFSVGVLLSLPASAQSLAGVEQTMPLPPPPGPYLSSRTQLEQQSRPAQNTARMPFVSNMPSMPMQYMPSRNPLYSPPPWWRGPMGR